jgi:hypothetical protein
MNKEQLNHLTDSFSDEEIAQQLGVDRKTISNWRRKLDVQSFNRKTGLYRVNGQTVKNNRINNPQQEQRSGHVTFFDILDTPAKAYFLGFLTADGGIKKNLKEVSVLLQERDSHILETLLLESGFPSAIRRRLIKGYPSVEVTLSSTYMVRRLVAWGLTPRKSLTVKLLEPIPIHLQSDFLRGLWDGDGWVGEHHFGLGCGSIRLVEQVQKMIYLNTDRLMNISKAKNQNLYYIQGHKKDKAIIQWIYQNPYPVLVRKAIQFSRFWKA